MLQRKLKHSVYAFAPADIDMFLAEDRFKKEPPEVIIFVVIERDVATLSHLRFRGRNSKSRFLHEFMTRHRLAQEVSVLIDRLCKQNMLNYIRSYVRRFCGRERSKECGELSELGIPVFFLHGLEANVAVSDEAVARSVSVLREYAQKLDELGIAFIFVAVPNKENIYSDLLTGSSQPRFLSRLLDALRTVQVRSVDLESAYRRLRVTEPDELCYHTDDTHWNSRGIEVAADLLAQELSGR